MSNSNAENTKRIAKNTLMLYVRMLFTMVVSLYTSRVILSALGVVDYGVYNVVGGVVTMFSVINSCMTTSTQRFMTFELGTGNQKRLNDVFSIALLTHIAIGIIVILLCESIGLWFLNNKLVIPSERMTAARWVFQISLLQAFIGMIQIPFNSAIVAHERMDIFAFLGILETILKLVLVLLLTLMPTDKLITWACFSFATALTIRVIYQTYCRRHFEECRLRFGNDVSLFKEMFSFAGWNMFGSVAWMLRDQGLNMLLNMFWGPVINAARGVALQVSNAVSGFVSNFNTAINPQITKSYAANEKENMETMALRASKFSFLLLFFIALPLIVNIDFILRIWLSEVPEYTSIFVILILADSLVGALLNTPFITSLMATGKIRNYQIVVSVIIMMIVPASYILLRLGMNPASVFYVTIVFTLISGLARFAFCVKQIGYKWSGLINRVFMPILGVILLSVGGLMVIIKLLPIGSEVGRFIILCFASILINGMTSFFVGLSKNERTKLVGFILNKIKK